MPQNGQTHFKNLAANATLFLKCVWPFWDIMHWRVKNEAGGFRNKTSLWEYIFVI